MPSFEALVKAKTLLGLHDKASRSEIKSRYKSMMQQWHPDKHPQDPKTAHQMSAQINQAYETVMSYCDTFRYPFDEESLKKTTQNPHEWWHEHFGPN